VSQLRGPAIAPWYDPTSGRYSTIGASPFAETGYPFLNQGAQVFFSPGRNSGDNKDRLAIETA
jgi:hypothetical protein